MGLQFEGGLSRAGGMPQRACLTTNRTKAERACSRSWADRVGMPVLARDESYVRT
jgi:hypothetical protein